MSDSKQSNLIVIKPYMNGFVSDSVILQLMNTIQKQGYTFSRNVPPLLNRVISKYHKQFSSLFGRVQINNPMIFIHGDWKLHVPYIFMKSNLKILWTYDLWETAYNYYEEIITRFNINVLFSSNLQSVEYFNSKSNFNCVCYWIPEGVDSSCYENNRPIESRTIDIMQFGRKWELYHNNIAVQLNDAGKKYLYETTPGKVIFNNEKDFVTALGDTKISICVPANITHPEKAGNVSTVTNRFLQSFSSKTLVLGIKPSEMHLLFDYEPLIRINMENPVGQIMDILENISEYTPIIEKNYTETLQKHQWRNRIVMIEDCLSDYRKR